MNGREPTATAQLDALLTQYIQLKEAYIALEADLAAARAEAERERMRLAACGVAAMGNTEAMVADRLTPDHPYYSASYGDVCRAVDREMAHRDEAARLRDEVRRLQKRWDRMMECIQKIPMDKPITGWAVLDAVASMENDE